jgi:hypothetical protein
MLKYTKVSLELSTFPNIFSCQTCKSVQYFLSYSGFKSCPSFSITLYCKTKPWKQLVRLIAIRSYKNSVLVTGESRNFADCLAARLCCSCTVGKGLVGWVGTYEYAQRRNTVVACVVSFVSALGQSVCVDQETDFFSLSLAQCIMSPYSSWHCCSVERAHLVSWPCVSTAVKCALYRFRTVFVILEMLNHVKSQLWFDPYFFVPATGRVTC